MKEEVEIIQDHVFENKFSNYLKEKYKTYASINILAFRNQQRLLKDIYIPLTLKEESYKATKPKQFKITAYKDNFIPKYKKVLITDTAGMGKSTLSRKLFLSAIEKNAGVPVLIELRRLSEERTILDEIFDELKILNEDLDKEFVLELIKRGDFIFFLDGYYEIPVKSKKAVTENLQKFINHATENYFVLTSRPEESLTAFGQFQSFSINGLAEKEVSQLLRKYDGNRKLSRSLIEKLKEGIFEELKEFLSNPLLTSMLYTAYEFKPTIPLKKHLFYRQVYDALFEAHDLSKGDYFQREKRCGLGIDDFHTVMRYVAFICLKKDQIEFTKDELLKVIKLAKKQCEIIEFKESLLLDDLVKAVPLFAKDGLRYKWAHKSIYEYFVAQFIHVDTGKSRQKILNDLVRNENGPDCQHIIEIYATIDYKSFKNELVYHIVKEYIESYEKHNYLLDQSNKLSPKVKDYISNYFINVFNLQYFKNDNQRMMQMIEFSSNMKFNHYILPFPLKEPLKYFIELKSRKSYDYIVIIPLSQNNESLIHRGILDSANYKMETLSLLNRYFQSENKLMIDIVEFLKENKDNSAKKEMLNKIFDGIYSIMPVFNYVACKAFVERIDKMNVSQEEDHFLSI